LDGADNSPGPIGARLGEKGTMAESKTLTQRDLIRTREAMEIKYMGG